MTEPLHINPPEANEIADILNETERAPRVRIGQIVRLCGVDFGRAILVETLKIEQDGGMQTSDGTRRRTTGGVWFYLARGKMTREQRAIIFPHHPGTGTRQPARPVVPSIAWEERDPLVREAAEQKGTVQSMNVQIIGRPSKIIERDTFALLLLTHRGPMPSLPKGTPVPPKFPATDYVVYIGAKQWRGVREAIRNPDDALIVKGVQFLDPQQNAIAVFATSVTTKRLAQAQREQQAQAAKPAH